MIKNIIEVPTDKIIEWCDHCGKRANGIRRMYFVSSTNPGVNTTVLCNCCVDMALNNDNILPEEF